MARVLIIHGGQEFARRVYQEEGRGYWTAALPLVLEKHGIAGVTVEGPERLSDPRIWDEYDAVLVGRLPEGSWSRDAVDRAIAAPGGAVVEGPVPEEVAVALGVTAAPAGGEGHLEAIDARLRSLAAEYGVAADGWVNGGTSRPIDRSPELDWARLGVPISP